MPLETRIEGWRAVISKIVAGQSNGEGLFAFMGWQMSDQANELVAIHLRHANVTDNEKWLMLDVWVRNSSELSDRVLYIIGKADVCLYKLLTAR